MKFKEFIKLTESIPAGSKNKELWLNYIKEKYGKNPENLYITFVYQDKVGINPKTEHDTPSGVYTYPLEYVLKEGNVPYRGETKPKKVKILKTQNDKVLSDKLTEKEYEEDIKKLGKWVEENNVRLDNGYEKFVKWYSERANVKTPFGKLWNVTRIISADYYRKTYDKSGKKIEGISQNISVWSKILIYLGFDYVVDNGTEVIHSNEPTQALFLNSKSYKVIDETFVDTEERYKENTSKEEKEILEQLKKEGWGLDIIDDVLKINRPELLKITDKFGINALCEVFRFADNKRYEQIKKYFKKEFDADNDNYTAFLKESMSKDSEFFQKVINEYFTKSDGEIDGYTDFVFKSIDKLNYNNKHSIDNLVFLVKHRPSDKKLFDVVDFSDISLKEFQKFIKNDYEESDKEQLQKSFEKWLNDK